MTAEPFIAVCYPSRGMGFDPTIFGVIREIESRPYQRLWCPVFYRPIPEAHNEAARMALADHRVTHLWFVENDHLFPEGVLSALLAADAPIVAAEYVLRGGSSCVIRSGAGVELVGLGCTLVRREVFSVVPDPPFQVGNRQQWAGSRWQDTGVREHAGGQDIFFCRQVRAAGIEIAVLPGVQVGHLDVEQAGGHINAGMDWLRCWGGSADIPWYPPRRADQMGKRVFIKSPGGLVIDMDTSDPNYTRMTGKQGWVEVPASEARPALKDQEKANQAVADRVAARNADDD